MVYWVTEKSAIAYLWLWGLNSGGSKITSTGRSDGCNDDRIRSRCITKNGIMGGKCAKMIKIPDQDPHSGYSTGLSGQLRHCW